MKTEKQLVTEDLIGLPLKTAQEVLQIMGYSIRINQRNGLTLIGDCKVDVNRLNVNTEDNKIAKINGWG